MKRCLLLLVALTTISSTFALPTGEFPIAPRATALAPHDRRNLMLAANDDLALAVWEDFRVDPNAPPRIWATRFRRDRNEVLDPTGISVVALPAAEGSALRAVSTDGTDFLVAWTEGRKLKFARILANGTVVAVPDTNTEAELVSIAFGSGGYFVTFTFPAGLNKSAQSVELLILFKDGTVARRAGTIVTSTGVLGLDAAMSAHDTFLYVAWVDSGDSGVHAASFLTSALQVGTVVPPSQVPQGFFPGGVASQLHMATNGTDIVTVWYDPTVNPPVYRIRRFDGNGLALGPITTIEQAPFVPTNPALDIDWDGAQYVAAFEALDGSLQAVRYDGNAVRTDGSPLTLVSPVITGVALAASPFFQGSTIAWMSSLTNGAQVAADFLSPSGTLNFRPSNIPLSASQVDRSDAIVLWRGDHYLAAWQDAANVNHTVLGRISVDGQPLDGSGVDVSVGTAAGTPVLASNGHTAVVAWLDFGGVAASFVDEAGHVERRMFDFPGGVPSVNWNGQQYAVFWRSSQGQLLALRMTGSGALIDQEPVTIAPISGAPFVGWTGNSYVVAFHQLASCFPACPADAKLFAQLVSPSLVAIGSPIQLSDPVAGTPSIGDGPAGALIVWPRTSGNTTTLRAVRVVNGAVLDPMNGFVIGDGTNATVYGSAAGWGVVAGPYLWIVSRNGAITPRLTVFPFVPVGARASVVLGGPAPLVIYRRPPVGSEQMMQVVGRYLLTTPRERAVHH
jgi:hypothetical protein